MGGAEFECAHGDRCCGDVCVGKNDVCCENVLGNHFPCQGNGGGCCGNMRCTRQQVLQVPLGAESPVVPSHRGHQVRIYLAAPLRSRLTCPTLRSQLRNDPQLYPDLAMP